MGRPFPGQRIAAATTGAPGPVPEISKGLPGRGGDAPAGALGFYEDLNPVYLGAAGNAKFLTGEGMLKNISDGGILFQVELPLPVQLGHTREFSFPLIPDKNKQCDPTHWQAQGLVLRIEPPDPNSSAYGVAVQFLSALKKKDVTIHLTISSQRRVGTLPEPLKDER